MTENELYWCVDLHAFNQNFLKMISDSRYTNLRIECSFQIRNLQDDFCINQISYKTTKNELPMECWLLTLQTGKNTLMKLYVYEVTNVSSKKLVTFCSY